MEKLLKTTYILFCIFSFMLVELSFANEDVDFCDEEQNELRSKYVMKKLSEMINGTYKKDDWIVASWGDNDLTDLSEEDDVVLEDHLYAEPIKENFHVAFCTSCHEMKDEYQRNKKSLHSYEKIGKPVNCDDCHVNPGLDGTLEAKLGGIPQLWKNCVSREYGSWDDVVGGFNKGVISRERQEELSEHVIERMKKYKSITCKKCHNPENMEFSSQSKFARKKHSEATISDFNCIECHVEGVGHYPRE